MLRRRAKRCARERVRDAAARVLFAAAMTAGEPVRICRNDGAALLP